MQTPPHDASAWQVRESALDLGDRGALEAVLTLSNGYVGVRGTLDEPQPSDSRGTFMAGVYEYHPLSYPEGGYGHPEHGQAIVGVADGSTVHLQVDGVPLDLRESPPEHHERVLDLRAGTLERETQWTTPRGSRMRLASTRLVSLAHRSVTAIRYEVEALDRTVQVVLRSGLVANGTPPKVRNEDPRVAEVLAEPFRAERHSCHGTGGVLVHRTARSGIGVAAAVEHALDVPEGGAVSTQCDEDRVMTTVVTDLAPGQRLHLVKYLCHSWSAEDPADDLRGQVLAAMAGARRRGWEGLVADQRAVLDEHWAGADVEVDGAPDLQLALRFDLFQLLQASACVHRAPVGAKGLTGGGYSGHTFWDVEGFVLPALALLRPRDAARLLQWRSSTLDRARERARVLDLGGASFPWRTIDGHETSAYWPASTAAMHVNADIARAFTWWADTTGEELTAVGGVDVLVETARVWAATAHEDHDGGVHLLGMTGPDEYTGVVDDNVFTNLMARRNLRAAAAACAAHPDHVGRLGVSADELDRWRDLAQRLHVPFDEVRGVHPANAGFTTYREWDFEAKRDGYPIEEHFHYAKIYRRQVVKQADLVLALWWCAEDFTPEQTARDLDYYERRTVRDSSLSACVQAVVCARVGHLDLAHAYLREAALVDLRDLQQDTAEGLHLASAGGAWLALVCGLGGLDPEGGRLRLAPRLPAGLDRIAFRLRWRGRRLGVETTRAGTVVRVLDGQPGAVDLQIDGRARTAAPGRPATAPLHVPDPPAPAPVQPPGRAPRA
ncbi:glycosyl hydrolase [Kocuria flava]|uniref:Glycosyl hydrolase n=1 Tax=Kocuria flava TaxID=446860 RepID=A0A0U2NWK0_9MICC|nr:glycosyl hydrolase family 65 protein [Kocuria flava]ALU38621.1 glycosyl hydrolase [Kocuria flava]GEO91663.1 glycosyl hydrolase [Kocuria flava]